MAEDNEASRIEAGVEKLGAVGFSICSGILPLELVLSLVAEQRRREDGGELIWAGVGRGITPRVLAHDAQMLGASQRQARSSCMYWRR